LGPWWCAAANVVRWARDGSRNWPRSSAVLGYHLRFFDWLPRLFPRADARSWFIDKPDFAEVTAFRNGTLRGRALHACSARQWSDVRLRQRGGGPRVLPGGEIKSNFLCSVGYGDPVGLFERLPRPDFSEVSAVV
jgi:3-hydroxypropanoate dehydrogenase